MGPGPGGHTSGRFGILDLESLSEPKLTKKRKSTNLSPLDLNTSLPSSTNSPNPKFIVISPTDKDTKLSSFSVFLLKKAIDGISTGYESITQLRDGNLLILTKSKKIADIFLSKKMLSNICPISVSLHSNLNQSKGTVYAPCLINVPEEEIVEEMKAQGVTNVYKFSKPSIDKEGKQVVVCTGLILFTFDLFRPPTSLNIGWYNVKVQEFFPNPMRCRNCQLLGHTSKWCKGKSSCVTCNLPPHSPLDCTRVYCANCAENHPSSSRQCSRYLQAKEILKIKTVKKCSMAEARQFYNEQNPTTTLPSSYSAVVSNSSQTKSPVNTQTKCTTFQTKSTMEDKINSPPQSNSTPTSLAPPRILHHSPTSIKPSSSLNSQTSFIEKNHTDKPTSITQNNQTDSLNTLINTKPSNISHSPKSSSNHSSSPHSKTNTNFSQLPFIPKSSILAQTQNSGTTLQTSPKLSQTSALAAASHTHTRSFNNNTQTTPIEIDNDEI